MFAKKHDLLVARKLTILDSTLHMRLFSYIIDPFCSINYLHTYLQMYWNTC